MRAEAAETTVNLATTGFESGGKKIAVDHYAPRGAAQWPSVIVLHGAGGTLLDGPDMRRMSRELADAGNDVYLVHYFNRTGTLFGLDAGMQRNFTVWLETVKDAIKWVRAQRPHGGPIGIYGYSLGGFLALAAGSNNQDVGGIVEHAGGVWNNNARLIEKMPPVMIVHGLEDQRVPYPKYATPLTALLRQRGAHFETHFFKAQGHVFTQAALVDLRAETVKFFRQNLKSAQKR
jgi:dienelactone hydrolase